MVGRAIEHRLGIGPVVNMSTLAGLTRNEIAIGRVRSELGSNRWVSGDALDRNSLPIIYVRRTFPQQPFIERD